MQDGQDLQRSLRSAASTSGGYASVSQLVAVADAHAELRSTVKTFGRDLQAMMQQLHQLSEAQAAAAQQQQPAAGNAPTREEYDELKAQLAYVMSTLTPMRENADAAAKLQEEVGSMRRQLAGVVDRVEGRLEALQDAETEANAALQGAISAAQDTPVSTELLSQLQSDMEGLRAHVSAKSDSIGAGVEAAEAAACSAAERVAELEAELRQLSKRVADVAAEAAETAREAVAAATPLPLLHALQTAVEGLANEQTQARGSVASLEAQLERATVSIEQIESEMAAVREQLHGGQGREDEENDPVVRASELEATVANARAERATLEARLQLGQSALQVRLDCWH